MMSKEERIFFEIHSGLPREGPGSRESTRKAYSSIRGLPENPRILDVGCGPGAQTLELALRSGGEIHAVDNHPPFVRRVQERVAREGLRDRVFPRNADMNDLPFEDDSFDLIWAEGSIYIMGVENGLTRWRRLLRRPGFLAFSEVSWLSSDPPSELADFWREAYPAIGSREENERIINRAGFELLHSFVLPESDWWDEYYEAIERKLPGLKRNYQGDPEAMGVLEAEEVEMNLYRRYSAYYGYVFYVTRTASAT